MPVCRKLLKFAISTETSYSPAIRRGASKYPLALVTSCCETLVPVLVIFTSAPGRTPSLSRTVPEIVPRVSWAPTGMVVRHISSQAIPTHFCMGSTLVLADKDSDGGTIHQSSVQRPSRDEREDISACVLCTTHCANFDSAPAKAGIGCSVGVAGSGSTAPIRPPDRRVLTAFFFYCECLATILTPRRMGGFSRGCWTRQLWLWGCVDVEVHDEGSIRRPHVGRRRSRPGRVRATAGRSSRQPDAGGAIS